MVTALVSALGCGKSGSTITIGSLLSQTGQLATIGQEELQAAQLAVDQINDGGGVLGSSLVLINADDKSETNTGHCILAIDVARFLPPQMFAAEVDRHLRDLRQSKRLPGVDAIRLPGDRRRECREERLRAGVPLAPALLAQLDKLAAELKIKPVRER